MTHYAHGVRVEYLVRDHLTGHGWEVIRAAGSKGPVDLVGFAHGGIVAFVSVKRSGICRPAERRQLIGLADRLGAWGLPIVAAKPPRRPVTYRLLTGPGHRDWLDWEPAQETAA